jgi:hypothetical protein
MHLENRKRVKYKPDTMRELRNKIKQKVGQLHLVKSTIEHYLKTQSPMARQQSNNELHKHASKRTEMRQLITGNMMR